MPLTTVYITGPRGQYATNVDASSSHDAVRKAVAFFLDPFWKGPETEGGNGVEGVPDGREGNMGARCGTIHSVEQGPVSMEVYKSETREILRRYRAGEISRHACINALDAAVAGLVPRLTADQINPLRALLTANNEALVREAKRRGQLPKIK